MAFQSYHDVRTLSESEREQLIPVLLADDSPRTKPVRCRAIRTGFVPCSFTVLERLEGRVPLVATEGTGEEWVQRFVDDAVDRFLALPTGAGHDREALSRAVRANLLAVLEWPHEGRPVAAWVWNQEFVDVARKVLVLTALGDAASDVDVDAPFNDLALRFVPRIIDALGLSDGSDLGELLRFSIASGLAGLDRKGAPAASSPFGHAGIPMAHLEVGHQDPEDVQRFARALKHAAAAPCPLFHLTAFLRDVETTQSGQLIWFADDLIESHFDLLLIQGLLNTYRDLRVVVVPKNGHHGNDLSWQQLEAMLGQPAYRRLGAYAAEGRFSWTRRGPSMGCVDLSRLGEEVLSILQASDLVVIKGCRAHELMLGGLLRPTYTAYVVAREFSATVSGYSPREAPLLFFRLDPGAYAFFGVLPPQGAAGARVRGASSRTVLSTTRDHFGRAALESAPLLREEIERVQRMAEDLHPRDRAAALVELDWLRERLTART